MIIPAWVLVRYLYEKGMYPSEGREHGKPFKQWVE
jgi:hypothetical protein